MRHEFPLRVETLFLLVERATQWFTEPQNRGVIFFSEAVVVVRATAVLTFIHGALLELGFGLEANELLTRGRSGLVPDTAV